MNLKDKIKLISDKCSAIVNANIGEEASNKREVELLVGSLFRKVADKQEQLYSTAEIGKTRYKIGKYEFPKDGTAIKITLTKEKA